MENNRLFITNTRNCLNSLWLVKGGYFAHYGPA